VIRNVLRQYLCTMQELARQSTYISRREEGRGLGRGREAVELGGAGARGRLAPTKHCLLRLAVAARRSHDTATTKVTKAFLLTTSTTERWCRREVGRWVTSFTREEIGHC